MTDIKNAVILEGVLTHDPKFSHNQYGKPMVSLSMNTQNRVKCPETGSWKELSVVRHKHLQGRTLKVLEQAKSFKEASLVIVHARLVYDKIIGRGGDYIDVPRLIVSDIQAVEPKAPKPTHEDNQKRLTEALAQADARKLTKAAMEHQKDVAEKGNCDAAKPKKPFISLLASALGALVFFI